MAFSFREITHEYLNLDGTPSSGQVVVELTLTMRNGGVSYSAGLPKASQLNSAGLLSVTLPCTDDPGTQPDGCPYTVTEKILGSDEQTWTISLPHGEGPIDLAALLPTVAA